jgi:hypothetical protein
LTENEEQILSVTAAGVRPGQSANFDLPRCPWLDDLEAS